MLSKIVLLLVFVLDLSIADETVGPDVSATDDRYCKLKCGKKNHTMCSRLIPRGGPPAECSDFIAGLTEEEKDSLLETHNELRRQVAVKQIEFQPMAANMMKLAWDDELALVAQRWADQCAINEHDNCRITLAREEVGQNLQLIVANSRMHAMTAILYMWFEQHAYFDASLVDKYTAGDPAGSYCQLVWATTTRVGCGFAAQEKELDNEYKLVCNYVPVGLVDGREVYVRGKPCTNCPEGTLCSGSVPGLCTSNTSDYMPYNGHARQPAIPVHHLLILIPLSNYCRHAMW